VFWLWVGLILFSQTALAGRLADALVALFTPSGPAAGGWPRVLAQKAYHVVLFGGMGALLALRTKRASQAERIGWCAGFSAFAESLQILAANRHASPWDALLNIAAAFTLHGLAGRATASGSRPESFRPPPR
jgi:hypothetical protein